MLCDIWYHLYILECMENTHKEVLLSVKLQASALNFIKSNSPPGVFFTFLNCANGTKSRKASDMWTKYKSYLIGALYQPSSKQEKN